ncbi:hypothetical protein BpHYR1_036547 [Brachionus plicatilis]|uniref:Uncharacterized protein n=1 Tax=Brachionus plicatilis TaxID=10195 RepID=A0A3M7RWE6_BRAPC|nr:hypothetical protein BpHYR1_036547 [Brachionus plicatilis]
MNLILNKPKKKERKILCLNIYNALKNKRTFSSKLFNLTKSYVILHNLDLKILFIFKILVSHMITLNILYLVLIFCNKMENFQLEKP